MNSGEESALPMVSSSSSASDKYEGTASLDSSPEDDFSSLREVEVVRELGLITCVSGVFGQGARTPQLAVCKWLIALMSPTWRKRFRSRFR